jgi:hypothetical protein
VELAIPEFNVQFLGQIPSLSDKIANFLNLVDNALERLQIALAAFDLNLSTSLAQARASVDHNNFSPNSDSLPDANYFYGPIIREWLGHPAVILTVALVNEKAEDLSKKLDALTKQDISIVGEGGNLSSLRVAFSWLFSGWDLINAFVDNIDGNIEGSEVTASYLRLGHIHTDIDGITDSIAFIDSRLNSHIADFQVWKELSIRTQIEINLAGHGKHPHPVAIFQLPEQFGGYLELAREIVADVIQMMLAAGQDIHKANEQLIRGDERFAAGEYKKAYTEYSKSYDEATK